MAYSVKVRNNNGRCVIRFKCPIKGKQTSRTFGNFNNDIEKYEAEGVALRVQTALNNHTWEGEWEPYLPKEVKERTKSLIDLLEAKVRGRKKCTEKTLINKLSKLPPIRTPADMKRFMESHKGKASGANRYYDAISAVRPDLVDGVKKKRQKKTKPNPWQAHEKEAILQHFKGARHGELVWILFKTGMRPGEARALLPSDFIKSGDEHLISVTKNINENGLQSSTKDKRDRLVPLTYEDWQRAKNAIEANHEWYSRMDWSNFRDREWKRGLKAIGLKYKSPYSMRPTAISEYLNKRGSCFDASVIFGNSPSVIEKNYAGLIGTLKPL